MHLPDETGSHTRLLVQFRQRRGYAEVPVVSPPRQVPCLRREKD